MSDLLDALGYEVPPLTTAPLLVPGSLEHRTQPYVSASVCAALFGAHPFIDVAGLAALRRGETTDSAGEAAATGNVLEDVVAQWWADKTRVTVEKPDCSYICGPLSASPDRRIIGCTDTFLEVKTTSKEEGVVLPYWWWQVQCQMACTGARQVVLAVLWGGSLTLREHPIQRDDAAIAALLSAATTFLAYLAEGLEPVPVAREAAEATVELGAAEAELARQLAQLNEAANYAAKEAKAIRALLDAAVGGPGLAVGSRLTLTHEGKSLYVLTRQQGREETTGTGVYGDPFSVLRGVK